MLHAAHTLHSGPWAQIAYLWKPVSQNGLGNACFNIGPGGETTNICLAPVRLHASLVQWGVQWACAHASQ